jgi:hypothetical protein
MDKSAFYAAQTKAHWDREKARLAADAQAAAPNYAAAVAWFKALRADCNGHPLFPNLTAFYAARRP